MATLQGKAVKNTYKQVLQIGANNIGVSATLQPVQDGGGVNTALSLSTVAATINGTLTITGDLIITGGGLQIQDLIDDTVASLIQNGTGITWAYNDTARTLTPTITIATADGGVQGDFMQLNTGAGEANAVAKIYWNSTDGTAELGLMGGQVILPIGQKQVARVLNNSGSIFTKAGYQVVKITAAQGQRLAVGLAQANNDANSTDTLGLVAENIANNQEGFITTSGLITGVDTTGDLQLEDWNDGDILYLSPTTPGAITKVKPVAPQHTIIVGFVVYAHQNNGKIFVKVDNGYELDELHNVRITAVADNNILQYNSSLAVWENVAGTTTNIAEGTNLYYTQARFDTAFAAKTTTNLTEGANLYFTTARGDANFATNFATKTTSNLPEGSNLYWTTARGNSNFTTNLAASSTTNLAEGTNLYYTQARFDTAFSNKSTTNLAEGTNLYYTTARFNTALATKTTTDLAEGTNLYYTDTRARLALSSSATGLTYANNSGVFSLTAGYAIPTTVKLGQYDTAYNRSIVSAAVTGTSTKTLTLTEQDANTITATWTDQGITTINGTANQIAANTVGNTTTIGFTNDVTMPNNLIVSGNLTINGTATYVNTQSISAKDPLFEVANDNNTTDAVDIGYYGRYYDTPQTRIEFTGLFRDASDAGKFKFFTGLVDEPTNVVNTTGTGYTVGTLVANFEGNLAGTANAANILSTARSISTTGDAAWTVNFDGSANATAALTLANTGVTATTYGTSTAVPTIAIDSKGRITSASNTNIAFPVTTVNGAAGTVVLTTTNIAEGTNQYFTTGRAQSAISLTTTGTSGAATYSSGVFNIPTYIGGSGTANEIAYFSTTGVISSLATATYPSLTELSYVKGVTSAIQTQLNTKALDSNTVHISGTETITGAKTFSAALAGTTATLSSSLSAANATLSSSAAAMFTINSTDANGGYMQFQRSGTVFGYIGSAYHITTSGSNADIAMSSTANLIFATGSSLTERLRIRSTGAATFTFDNNSSGVVYSRNVSGTIYELGSVKNSGSDILYQGTGNVFINADSNSDSGATDRNVIFGNRGVEYARITSGGNVGIGTSSPTMSLDIVGTPSTGYTSTRPLLNLQSNQAYSTAPYTGINFSAIYNSGGGATSLAFIGGGKETSGDGVYGGFLKFSTRADGSSDITERMRITSGGQILMGGLTSDPLSSSSALVVKATGTTFGVGYQRAIEVYDAGSGGGEGGAIVFSSATCPSNAAIYSASANPGGSLVFATNSANTGFPTDRLTISAAGNVAIGRGATTDSRFIVSGQTNDGSSIAFIAQDLSTNNLFYLRCDGYINTGVKSVSPYNFSTSGRSAVIDAAGGFGYLVSTRESKSNIESIKSIDFINKLNPVQFNYRKKDNLTNEFTDELYDNITYGFIADEVEKVNKDLVFYNSDGTTLAGVEYNNMIAILTKAIQEQQAQIEELKAMIAAK